MKQGDSTVHERETIVFERRDSNWIAVTEHLSPGHGKNVPGENISLDELETKPCSIDFYSRRFGEQTMEPTMQLLYYPASHESNPSTAAKRSSAAADLASPLDV